MLAAQRQPSLSCGKHGGKGTLPVPKGQSMHSMSRVVHCIRMGLTLICCSRPSMVRTTAAPWWSLKHAAQQATNESGRGELDQVKEVHSTSSWPAALNGHSLAMQHTRDNCPWPQHHGACWQDPLSHRGLCSQHCLCSRTQVVPLQHPPAGQFFC